MRTQSRKLTTTHRSQTNLSRIAPSINLAVQYRLNKFCGRLSHLLAGRHDADDIGATFAGHQPERTDA